MNGEYPAQVVDERGGRHELTRLLGRGGQGAVFRTRDPDLVVKLIAPAPGRRAWLDDQLKRVRVLLSQSPLPIARPLAVLRPPSVGYVMRLLTGMSPLAELVGPPAGQPALDWYHKGGGLARRLRLLARAAEALASLHGASLVYADPSPNNIFVSSDADAEEVWLIDADNVHHQGASGSLSVYTPAYGAPELVTANAVASTRTDAHAFAVIAFWTLCQVHPLLGDYVTEGEPELEEAAFAGQVPWIDHPDDHTNRASTGLPRAILLSRGLRELFQQCFGTGLLDPARRPGLAQWVEALHSAADGTLACPGCGWTYYANVAACPRCDRDRPSCVRLSFQTWEPEANSGRGDVVLVSPQGLNNVILSGSRPLTLTARLVRAERGPAADAPCAELKLLPQGVHVRLLEDSPYWLSRPGGAERIALRGTVTLPVRADGKEYRLHCGPPDRPHRVALFFATAGSP